jgi:hypothetical protein
MKAAAAPSASSPAPATTAHDCASCCRGVSRCTLDAFLLRLLASISFLFFFFSLLLLYFFFLQREISVGQNKMAGRSSLDKLQL